MATGKTINELPDVGQLTGGEMIPVSSHTQNKYTTGKTTVKKISDNVMISVDERLTSYVSNESLNITLESYVSNEALETKLSSYVSNEALETKLSSYVSNEALETKLSSYASTASVDEKLKSYVSNESLNTTLKSYVSDEALETKLSSYASTASVDEKLKSYVSNETLTNYSTTSEVNDKISVANDTVTAAIDKKISDSGYITRQDAIDIASYYNTFAIANTDFTPGINMLELAGCRSSSDIDNVTCELRDHETNKLIKENNADAFAMPYPMDDTDESFKWSVIFSAWYNTEFERPAGVGEHGIDLICKDKLTGRETSKWLRFDNYTNSNVHVLWTKNNVIDGKDLHGLLSYTTVVNTDGLPFVCHNYSGSGRKDNELVCCGIPREIAAFTEFTTNYKTDSGGDLSQYVNDTATEFMVSYTCGIMIPSNTKRITVSNTAPDTSYCDVITTIYTGNTPTISTTTYAGNTGTLYVSQSYTDIVDPSYSPAGQTFTKSIDIDWDTQYITAKINVDNLIGVNANILSVGNNIGTHEDTNLHIYYTKSTNALQILYTNAGKVVQHCATLNDASTIDFEISKKNGLVIKGTKYNMSNRPLGMYSSLFALTNIQVGASEGSVHSTATYKYIHLNTGNNIGVRGNTFLTINAQKHDSSTMTELPDLSYIKISFS